MTKITRDARTLYDSLVERLKAGRGPGVQTIGMQPSLAGAYLDKFVEDFGRCSRGGAGETNAVERRVISGTVDDGLLTVDVDRPGGAWKEERLTVRTTPQSLDRIAVTIPEWGRASVKWYHVDKTDFLGHFQQEWVISERGANPSFRR